MSKLDAEIVKELKKLEEYLRLKSEMKSLGFKTEIFISDNGREVILPPKWFRAVFTSKGLRTLESGTTHTTLSGIVTTNDFIRGALAKSAAKLREKLKDRYPEQYEEWKLGTEAYKADKTDRP